MTWLEGYPNGNVSPNEVGADRPEAFSVVEA
jgi:hypothetical protein